MKRQITLPISSADARDLRVSDILYVTGELFTARDEAHRLLLARHEKCEALPFDPTSMALFHCGPVVRRTDDGWRVLAAGPTTSIRMEPHEARFLDAFGSKIVIGKGGMGAGTQAALERHGAVYAHYTGGAGALAAKAIERVTDVFWLEELGMAEAVWIFHVKRFGPLYVTMDSVGGNLYTKIENSVGKNRAAIHARIDR
jgi:tartrate/fumarate subfamily iron-sulfur-dependent hydro-lyase beta chain